MRRGNRVGWRDDVLSPIQVDVLAEYQGDYLAGLAPPRMAEVARRLGCPGRQWILPQIRALGRKGWLARHPSLPGRWVLSAKAIAGLASHAGAGS